MPKFRKKSVVIEAVQYEETPEIIRWLIANQGERKVYYRGLALFIPTLEGDHEARPGDWIIRGVAGELYPCKPEIFEATYEPVEGE